jgi:multiple antibiotic resistance protein
MDRLEYISIIMFVTLGPLKVVGPFTQLTARFDASVRRGLALKATLVSTLTGLFIVFGADIMRSQWRVGTADLLVTFGILILLAAMHDLKSAEEGAPTQDPPSDPKGLAMSPIAFPTIITPYGIAALLVFAAVAEENGNLLGLLEVFGVLMVLNFLAMVFSRQVLAVVRPQLLRAIGWVLSVLQASLAVAAISKGLSEGLLAAT